MFFIGLLYYKCFLFCFRKYFLSLAKKFFFFDRRFLVFDWSLYLKDLQPTFLYMPKFVQVRRLLLSRSSQKQRRERESVLPQRTFKWWCWYCIIFNNYFCQVCYFGFCIFLSKVETWIVNIVFLTITKV